MTEILMFTLGALFGLWFFQFTTWGIRSIYFLEDCLADLKAWWTKSRRGP